MSGTTEQNETARQQVPHEHVVMSLQPCPHCGNKPIDAYKKEDRFGMAYYLVFEKNDCLHCYSKTGILMIPIFTMEDREIAEKFRLET